MRSSCATVSPSVCYATRIRKLSRFRHWTAEVTTNPPVHLDDITMFSTVKCAPITPRRCSTMLDSISRSGYGRNRRRIGKRVVEVLDRWKKHWCRPAVGTMVNFVLISVAFIMVAGCSGQMRGLVRDDGSSVEFWYEQGISSDLYFAVIDGENFEGRAVMVGAEETYATVFGTGSDAQTTHSSAGFISAFSTTGKVKAVLLGNRGSTLRCLMQYADSSGFTTPGGVGECVHSDNRKIDVVW